MKNILFFFIIIAVGTFTLTVSAQKVRMVRIMNAESMENGFSSSYGEYQRLIKKVYLKHEGMRMWCDSAHYFATKNQFTAFGRVRIRQGDSINITSRKLIYDGFTRIAQLRKKVVYKDDSATLYTDYIDYDLKRKEAIFKNGGRIIDSNNTLTAENGIYQTDTKSVSFSGNTRLKTKEAIITADTLQYNTTNNIAYLFGPTKIKKNDGSILNASGGQYNTKTETSNFEKATISTSENIEILGDKITPDEKELTYEIEKNVALIHKIDSVVITGEYAYYSEKDSIAYVLGNPVMRKIFKDDTLYIRADTLMMKENPEPKKQNFFAYHDVKILKKNMSAIADSLVVQNIDSSLMLYIEPVIWFKENQAIADEMIVNTKKGKVKKFTLKENALLLSKDSTSQKFNQLTGKNIIAHFQKDSLKYADVLGNAESILLVNEENNSNSINNTQSKNMRIYFEKKGIKAIKSFKNIDGKVIPADQLKKRDTKLDNFKWLIEKSPKIIDIYPDGIPKLPDDILVFKKKEAPTQKDGTLDTKKVKKEAPTQKDGTLDTKKAKKEALTQKDDTLDTKKAKKDAPTQKDDTLDTKKAKKDAPTQKDDTLDTKKEKKGAPTQKDGALDTKKEKREAPKKEEKPPPLDKEKEEKQSPEEDKAELKRKKKQKKVIEKQRKIKERIRKKQIRKQNRKNKRALKRELKKIKYEEKIEEKIEKKFNKTRIKLIKKAKKRKEKSITNSL